MIFPTSFPNGPWLLGPRRRRLSLLDERFRLTELGAAPFTTTNGRMVSPKWLGGVIFAETGIEVYPPTDEELEGDPDAPTTFEPHRPTVRPLRDESDKPADRFCTEHLAYPFEVVAGTKVGIPAGEDFARARDRNRMVIDNWLGWSFARALIEHPTSAVTIGTESMTPLSLASVPMELVSTNVPIIEAFVGVDAALSDLLGDEQGMIHLSPAAYGWVQTFGDFQFDKDAGLPMSPMGHYVIAEVGYDGLTGPDGEAAEAGTDWVVGTPLIRHFHTGLYSPGGLDPQRFENAVDDTILFNPSTNMVLGIDELWGILVVRPAAVAALGAYPTGA